jgi:hypothetical protein
LTIAPSNFEVGLDTIRFRDRLDDQVAVVELGIAKPKAEFEPRGDIFLEISHKTLVLKFVKFAYSIKMTVVNLEAIRRVI